MSLLNDDFDVPSMLADNLAKSGVYYSKIQIH